MELKILELCPNHAFGYKTELSSGQHTKLMEYEFANIELAPYKVLVITDFADQEYLYKHKEKIEQFLNEGKIVVFCGHLFREWLPGCTPMMPKKIRGHQDYLVEVPEDSPIFKGVKVEDMVYTKGVAGFFARGFYLPPKHAEICLTFTDGKAITYIDRETTNGTVIVHAGRSLLGYGQRKNTTNQITPHFIEVLKKEIVRTKGVEA
ncbi:phosphate starvation-inducible protein PhoH [Pradoshia sp. D12]|uniref:phosphate starvation-inducible protein PhoH n=1 Tax=Bacillaceae TaxID=186817 RepID=UPI00112DD81A|nr:MULTISPECIES: phosphate starvation-inducible protein PhoH [Bacillaceae]QFK72155.1 phosphate starvation-inducible protein PhoH [Pradoshia sp. D12]TPF71353.1 phosphate starvation-inducible protein PhoH [Bacillus sp. D12]